MKNTLLIFILSLFCVSLNAQISSSERQILLDFYTSTNGENWTHSWDLNQPAFEWHGITIEDNKVIGISLLFNNIEGELPSSIGQLKHLQVLELSFNKLSGEIPTELGKLLNLNILAFNGNDITGTIPSSLGNLSNLTQLHLSSNQLTGELPETIANLNLLEVLNVFDNDLSGNIPSQLAYSRNLKELIVAENNFEATNEFSALLLSNGASLDLKYFPLLLDEKHIIAIESEEEN